MKNLKTKTKVAKGQKVNTKTTYEIYVQERKDFFRNLDKDKSYTLEERIRLKDKMRSDCVELMRITINKGILIKQIRREIQEEKFIALIEKIIQEFTKSKVKFRKDATYGKMDMEEFLYYSAFFHVNSTHDFYKATTIRPSGYPKGLYNATVDLGKEFKKAFNLPKSYLITEAVEDLENYFSYLTKEVLHKNKISFSWKLPNKIYCPTIDWDSPDFKLDLPDYKLD